MLKSGRSPQSQAQPNGGSWRWLKRSIVVLTILGLSYGTLKSPLGKPIANWGKSVLSWGLVASIPADSGEPVDAIVVLGRGSAGFLMESRVDIAVELLEQGRAPFVFASGEPEAQAMMKALIEAGISPEKVRGEACSQTTEENALFTASILLPENAERILLLTDVPHMPRSLLTFRSLGFEVVPHPTPFPLNDEGQLPGRVVLREYTGLLGYAAFGRFLPRTFTDPRFLTVNQLDKALSGGCTALLVPFF